MKNVALLIHDDVVLSTVAGPMDMFIHTNRYLQQEGEGPFFNIVLVGDKPYTEHANIPVCYAEYKCYTDLPRPDLIIVPAFYGSPDVILKKHGSLIEWLKHMHNQGAELASLCSGSYFLAETGLLNGKACTSHWRDMPDLNSRFPAVEFHSGMVITDQEGIYTSGGAFSSLNLILYLFEKYCGKEIGVWASKMFSLDIDRVSQSHFAIFQGQRTHKDEGILRAQTFIEKYYQDEISIDDIAGQANMSKRNFIRRFKTATQNTPIEYLQRVKIEVAKKALEKNEQNVSSLMYEAGYNDIKAFRKVFKRYTGLTPQDYRRKYSRAV